MSKTYHLLTNDSMGNVEIQGEKLSLQGWHIPAWGNAPGLLSTYLPARSERSIIIYHSRLGLKTNTPINFRMFPIYRDLLNVNYYNILEL